MYILQIFLVLSDSVAENIITCFWCFILIKIDCTCFRMSTSSIILSHSSRINTCKLSKFNALSLTSCKMRPGVPITMCGGVSFNVFNYGLMGTPPKKHSLRMFGRYFVNLSHSFLIWCASSLVLQRMRTEFGFGSSSSWCKTERIKTAVFPLPEIA